ncbi:MAG TPA: hypothetical protein VLM85_25140 [Polyangiaceae bacterium]|nr:hypothetical protein [Polyangiaceae bacterium]
MIRTRSFVVVAALATALAGCGARTSLGTTGASSSSCPSLAPACVAPGADPCGPWQAVAASCDAASHEWSCPSGSRVHARAAEQPDVCLPFHDQTGVASLGGSLVRVPTGDGRCLWIAEDVSFTDGTSARNLAFTVDPAAPFATCPKTSATPPAPAVTLAGGDDPSILVQIDGGYRLGGETHVVYRLFRLDASSAFGVVDVGGGVAHWDAGLQRIVVPPPASLAWGTDLDLGDAMLVEGDHALVWGCPGPPSFLTESCVLARLDANDSLSLVPGSAFDSGPWISSVVRTPAGGALHVYAVGFGTDLQTHEAAAPEGPWSAGAGLGRCALPAADAKAFCAGPVVHEELCDPTRPGEWAVTYGVGSTGTRTGNPDDYWSRLTWVH